MRILNGRAYNADCFDILKDIPNGSIDCIITDPPYGMNYISSRRKCKHKAIEGDKTTDMQDFFNQSFKVLKDNTHIYVFCNEYCIGPFREQMITAGFNMKRMLVWKKNNHTSGDLKGDYANQTEYILFAHKGRRLLKGNRERNVIEFKRANTDNHPTAKPFDMIEYFIQKSTDEGDTILDPFAGSFTTAVACENTNRKWICIEKDEGYYNIGINRINNII